MANGWSGPTPVQQDDGPTTNYELGTGFTVNADITIDQVAVWHGASSNTIPGRKGRVWNGAGSLLAEAQMTDTLPPGWSMFDLTGPLEQLAGSTLFVTYTTKQFYGVVAGGYPRASADGLVTATTGRFTESALGVFPVTPTGSFYGIDIVYEAGVGGNVPPVVSAIVHQVAALTVNLLLSTVDEGAITYTIEWGDGSSTISGMTSHLHSYAVPGAYIILVTAKDTGGLSDSTAIVAVSHGTVSAETIANRRITKAFIDARPSAVALTPRIRYRLGTGAWKWQPQSLRADQIMRVIEQGPPEVFTVQDGVQRRVDYVMLAEWNALIAKGDIFTYDNDVVEVIELYHHNGYEVRAALERRLDPPV